MRARVLGARVMVEAHAETGCARRREAAVDRVDAGAASTSSLTQLSAKSLKCSRIRWFGVATAKWMFAIVPTGPHTLCGASGSS